MSFGLFDFGAKSSGVLPTLARNRHRWYYLILERNRRMFHSILARNLPCLFDFWHQIDIPEPESITGVRVQLVISVLWLVTSYFFHIHNSYCFEYSSDISNYIQLYIRICCFSID